MHELAGPDFGRNVRRFHAQDPVPALVLVLRFDNGFLEVDGLSSPDSGLRSTIHTSPDVSVQVSALDLRNHLK